MHLISALAGGVVGCESGTFSIVRRGTSTPASYYTDFEGLTAPITGTNVPLDARGGGVFYVNELVKVTCKNAAGTTIREFVAGDEATCLDVRSDSFTGTHYQTGAVAAGNPITLKALLDKWDDSAGADDWKVRVAGADVTLQAAFAALQGQRRFVVTSYGAVGDGVTNDTSAINTAISAANAAGGGVVFFPPGNYVCTAVTAFSTVSLEGSGPALTTITLVSSAWTFISGVMPAVVRGFRMTYNGVTGSGIYISAVTVSAGKTYLVEDCEFVAKGSGSGSGVITFNSSTAHSATVNRCAIEVGNGAAGTFNGTGCSMRVLSTIVRAVDAASAGTQAFRSDTGSLEAVACTADFSAVTSGSPAAFVAINSGSTLAVGNRVVPPGTGVTSWSVFSHGLNRQVVESGNSVAPTSINHSSSYLAYPTGGAAGSQYGSRHGSYVSVTDNADPIVLPLIQAGVVKVRVSSTAAHSGNCDLQGQTGTPAGLQCLLSIWNDTGGSITFQWSSFFASTGTFSVAANSVRSFLLSSQAANSGTVVWFLASDLAGAEVPE